MSWPGAAIVLLLVGGSMGAAAMDKENLSMVLAGAAAGYITANRQSKEEKS